MIAALLPILGPILSDVVGRVLPADKNKAQEVERELSMALMQNTADVATYPNADNHSYCRLELSGCTSR